MTIRLEIIHDHAHQVIETLQSLCQRFVGVAEGAAPTTIDVGAGTVTEMQPEAAAPSAPVAPEPALDKPKRAPRTSRKTEPDPAPAPQGNVSRGEPPMMLVGEDFDDYDARVREFLEGEQFDTLFVATDAEVREARTALENLYNLHGDDAARATLKLFGDYPKVSDLRSSHIKLFCAYATALKEALSAKKKAEGDARRAAR